MAEKKPPKQSTLDELLAECKRLREQSARMAEQSRALSAQVALLRKVTTDASKKVRGQ